MINKLSLNEVMHFFEVDVELGLVWWKNPTSRRVASGRLVNNPNKSGYYRVQVMGKSLMVHRIIFLVAKGYWPDEIDHIDNNVVNNRIDNLRDVTHQKNQMNMRIRSNNTSGVKGVCWCKHKKSWRARVVIFGRCYHAGFHRDIESARASVMRLREKLHGEFTNHG